jgi:hypothetical protein
MREDQILDPSFLARGANIFGHCEMDYGPI